MDSSPQALARLSAGCAVIYRLAGLIGRRDSPSNASLACALALLSLLPLAFTAAGVAMFPLNELYEQRSLLYLAMYVKWRMFSVRMERHKKSNTERSTGRVTTPRRSVAAVCV